MTKKKRYRHPSFRRPTYRQLAHCLRLCMAILGRRKR